MSRSNLKKQVFALTVSAAMCGAVAPAVAAPATTSTITTTTTTTTHFEFEYIFVYNHSEPAKTLPVNTPGAWTYRVTQGAMLVNVTKDAHGLLITPKPGAKGDVVIVITDAQGREHEYKITVDNTAPALPAGTGSPTTRTTSSTWAFNGAPGTGMFTVPAGGSWAITAGNENVDARQQGGQLLVTPKANADGKQFVAEIKDARGNTVQHTITISIRPTERVSQALLKSGEQLTIDDAALRNADTKWELQSGKELVTVEKKNDVLEVKAKHGVGGKATILITDKIGNQHTFSITVVDTTPQLRQVPFNLYDGGDYSFEVPADTTHHLVSGGNVVNVTRNGNEINVKAIDGVNGEAIMELVDGKSRLTSRYTFKVESTVPVNNTEITSVNITDRTQFRSTRHDATNTLTIVSGGALVDQRRDAEGALVIDPKQGAKGHVVIEETDARGNVIVRTTLNITPVRIGEDTHNISSLDTLQLAGSNLVVIKGADLVDTQKLITSLTVVPRDGAQGQVIVESRDGLGRTDTRFVINISPAKASASTITIPNNATHRLHVGTNSHTVVRGGDLITVTREGETLIITPRPGATGQAEIEVRNDHGQLIARHIVTITGPATIRLNQPNTDGSVTVTVPGSGGELVLLTDAPSHSIHPNPNNTWTITRNDGKPVTGDLKLAWTSGDGTTITNEISIKVEITNVIPAMPLVPATPVEPPTSTEPLTPTEPTEPTEPPASTAPTEPTAPTASSEQPAPLAPSKPNEVDGKCIAALAGVSAPLLLLIPLGILAQVKIPGLEHVHAQLNAAIQDANAKLQEGLGIYNKERAETAAGINQAMSIVNPQSIVIAGGAMVLVTAGLMVGDGVLRTCGYEEATSSHAVSKARSRGTGEPTTKPQPAAA